jgi:hypothetical protein
MSFRLVQASVSGTAEASRASFSVVGRSAVLLSFVGHLSLTPVNGPGYWNVDTAVIKRVRFKERLGIELRLEAFNVFNHTNFSVPNTLNIDDTDFGKINNAFDPRILQLSWKFTF